MSVICCYAGPADPIAADRLPDLADGRRGRSGGRIRDRVRRRSPGYTFNITASTESAEGFDEEREWVRGLWSALEPHHSDSVYVNFLMEEGEDRVREAYGAERYDRLKALKRKYDPENLFCLTQNIPPD